MSFHMNINCTSMNCKETNGVNCLCRFEHDLTIVDFQKYMSRFTPKELTREELLAKIQILDKTAAIEKNERSWAEIRIEFLEFLERMEARDK